MSKGAPLTLGREKRLRKRRDFLRVQKYGQRIFGRHVVVLSQRAVRVGAGRLGITVPKKVGPAHARNLVKRRIRHILRLNQTIFSNIDVVVIARESAHIADFSTLCDDVLSACQRFAAKNQAAARHMPTTRSLPEEARHEHTLRRVRNRYRP